MAKSLTKKIRGFTGQELGTTSRDIVHQSCPLTGEEELVEPIGIFSRADYRALKRFDYFFRVDRRFCPLDFPLAFERFRFMPIFSHTRAHLISGRAASSACRFGSS